MIQILYIGNSPNGHQSLDLDAEYSAIKDMCDKYPDYVSLERLINPKLQELVSTLTGLQPQVVHFGGHGTPDQSLYIIEDELHQLRPITQEDFQKIIQASNQTSSSFDLLILNACYSEPIAHNLSTAGIADCILSFQTLVSDDSAPEYVRNLYQGMLDGELVQEAVDLADIVTKPQKTSIFWNQGRGIDPNSYRLKDPTIKRLQLGQTVEGKELIEFLQEDDLGSMWLTGDGGIETHPIRRFIFRRILRHHTFEVDRKLEAIKRHLKDESGILIPQFWDFSCKQPFIEYLPEGKLLWSKSLAVLLEELKPQYPLDQFAIDEVNHIVFQLAQILEKAHQTDGIRLIHGRLNTHGIICVDRLSTESSTFGDLRPIIVDYGLSSISSRRFKNTNLALSPRVKNGQTPTKSDDVYSLLCIWFWLLTGQEPTHSNVSDLSNWFRPLNGKQFPFAMADYIQSIIHSFHENQPIQASASELREEVRKILPDSKLDASIRVGQNKINEIVNSLGMKFSKIPTGSYLVGSDYQEANVASDEFPKRLIHLNEYYIAQCVLTVENLIQLAKESGISELQTLIGPLKAKKNKKLPATTIFQNDSERPISWQFAHQICDILSGLPRERKEGLSYFLPTEAQWEVACRAGTLSLFNTGLNELALVNANFKSESNATPQLKPVQFYPPNRWNLYEMHGNVWEFCNDFYEEAYDVTQTRNPCGPQPKAKKWNIFRGKRFRKVIRGGDYHSLATDCRSAKRKFLEDKSHSLGELHEPDLGQAVGIRMVCYHVSMEPPNCQ